jgi:hypothetical protein
MLRPLWCHHHLIMCCHGWDKIVVVVVVVKACSNTTFLFHHKNSCVKIAFCEIYRRRLPWLVVVELCCASCCHSYKLVVMNGGHFEHIPTFVPLAQFVHTKLKISFAPYAPRSYSKIYKLFCVKSTYVK